MPAPAIEVRNVTKRFGAVTAIEDLSMHLERGEVLGLLGDNGAGKSTLIKILSGFHQPDEGEILIDGEPVVFKSVAHAREHGIDTVYQDLAVIDELTVWQNLHLNRELVHSWPPYLQRKKEMRRRARQVLDEIGISIPTVNSEIAFLSGGQRQAVAVARSVYSDADILLLDEPLAAMGAKESTIILRLIQKLKQQGDTSIIIIAHNYSQIFDVCDRINLIEYGRITFDKPVEETSVHEMTEIVASEYRLAGVASGEGDGDDGEGGETGGDGGDAAAGSSTNP